MWANYRFWITVAWEEYARSLHDFLTGQGTGIPVDFSTRRLVGIGHSMGALSLYVIPSMINPNPKTPI